MITEEEALAAARPGLYADLIVSALRIRSAADLLLPGMAPRQPLDDKTLTRARQTLHLARSLNMTLERPYIITVGGSIATLYAFNNESAIVPLKQWEPKHVTKLRKKWEKIIAENTDDLFLSEWRELHKASIQTDTLAQETKGSKTDETN